MLRDRKTGKLYYGYISTFLAGLTILGSTGILNNGSAQFIAELTVNKGWDPAVVGYAFSIRTLFSLTMPLVGLTVAKLGPRKCIFWTTLITSIFLVVTGYCTNAWAFALVFGVAVGFSMMFNDSLACQAVAANWWTSKRSSASGVVNGMAALGAMIIPPIIAILLNNFGWTVTLWCCGIGLFVITALPQFIWMKDFPHEVGQEMEGGNDISAQESSGTAAEINWEAKDALKTRQIWIVALCWGLVNVAYAAVMNFSVTHFVIRGMSNVQGSLFISVLSAVTVIMAFTLSGFVGKISPRLGYALACLLGGVGCMLVNTVTDNYLTWILPVVLFAFPNAMLQTLSVNAITRFYGPKNFAKIQSWMFPIFTLLAAGAASVIGNIQAATGELTLAFTGCGAVCLLGIPVALIFLKAPKVPEKYLSNTK